MSQNTQKNQYHFDNFTIILKQFIRKYYATCSPKNSSTFVKTKAMKYLYIFCLLLVTLTCKTGDVDYPYTTGDIKIYVAAPLTREQIMETDFDKWKLEELPWVDAHEIEFFDWSASMFYLRKNKEREKYAGRYFVVTSDEKRLFAGYFFPIYSSSLSLGPSILASDYLFNPLNTIKISGSIQNSDVQAHRSEEFRAALASGGYLREGISVELLNVQKSGTKNVMYTYKVSNPDKETILIPDPDKMGHKRFHYITNGVNLSDHITHYPAHKMTTTSFESFDDSWYYPLKPGECLIRSVIQGGFDELPKGNFTARFTFPGYINRDMHWKQHNGRIWVGDLTVVNSFYF